jgi:prepilin-type N-terminal cleavage/methylation domain-containing protein
MSSTTCSNRGMSLVEVLIALVVLNVGVLGLLSIQPSGWRLSGKSDFLGRAAGILHKELQVNEMQIMNPNNANPCVMVNPLVSNRSVWASGQTAAQPGDASFNVVTSIADQLNGTWLVTVTVTPPASSVGISDSLLVTRQEHFRQ